MSIFKFEESSLVKEFKNNQSKYWLDLVNLLEKRYQNQPLTIEEETTLLEYKTFFTWNERFTVDIEVTPSYVSLERYEQVCSKEDWIAVNDEEFDEEEWNVDACDCNVSSMETESVEFSSKRLDIEDFELRPEYAKLVQEEVK